MKRVKKANSMPKQRKSRAMKFHSVEEFKKEYFPRSSSQVQMDTETDPESHGVARAAIILDEVKTRLNHSNLNK